MNMQNRDQHRFLQSGGKFTNVFAITQPGEIILRAFEQWEQQNKAQTWDFVRLREAQSYEVCRSGQLRADSAHPEYVQYKGAQQLHEPRWHTLAGLVRPPP